MPTVSKKVARLSFLTEEGKTFTIAFDNPKTGITKEEIESVMEMIIAKNAILTPSGRLTGIRDIKVINTITEDLFDPPLV